MAAPRITLTTLVEAALAAFPGLGNRADDAADFVARGHVKKGNPQNGIDYWIIDGQIASIKDGSCGCGDLDAPRDANGPLCPHRLAAMFAVKLEKGIMDHLVHLFKSAPIPSITIKADVYYADTGRHYFLTGHHYPGQPWEHYTYQQRQRFTEAQFEAACRVAGWQLCMAPVKQPNIAFHYLLKPVDPAQPPTPWRLSEYAGEVANHLVKERRIASIARSAA